ncbi:putative fibroblast growth factor 1 [Porites lutea]|uniref:putative fibroblast growth factor 1 n=1 Tax=Porites lutea TaxID=51062 RepID=UPI003CC64CD8
METQRYKLFLSLCLYLFFYCTSLNFIQGIPINYKSSKDRQSRSRVAKSITHLHVVGNAPTNRVRAQLLSRTGYFLEILANGTIDTTLNNSSNYTILEIQTYNKTLKRFLGVHCGCYLAYEDRGKRRGKFIGTKKKTNDSLFLELFEENSFTTYRPLTYPRQHNDTGYLAIKENGKFRRVDRSKAGMQASQFNILEIK